MLIKKILNSIKDIYENLQNKEITLYDGSTTSEATLGQNIANFKIIKIYYTDTDNFKNCAEIFNDNTDTARAGLVNTNNNRDNVYKKCSLYY